jgi:phage tail sheath protein FI
MAQTYYSPGVYRQEIFLKAPPVLQTGVPGFVGFAGPASGLDTDKVINRPIALNRREEFSSYFESANGSFLADAIAGFFGNGGVRCYVVAADSSQNPVQGLVDAIAKLSPLEDMDLVAVPDASTLVTFEDLPDKLSIARVQDEMLTHCAQQGNRFAILDSFPNAGVDDVMDQCKQLVVGQQEPMNGALYYPWLVTSDGLNPVPPCGHVAGIYARSDAKTGVFKAPANEEIFGVLDLEIQIDNALQDKLNPARVNCLRAFPGRGIRVWGARTIGSVPPDSNWLYVNVRRLFLTVRRWIDLNMGWATFEPNDSRLWVRIQRELTGFLGKLQKDGALRGNTPAEAFFVKCDAENNPPEIRDLGQLIIEIGLAPLAPAEFIVVRIVRRAGGTPDN